MNQVSLEHGKSIDVLVVEDESRLRELLVSAIPEMGFPVSGATSAESALEAMKEHAYQIVLLDLNLPNMHGLELFGELRAQWPDVQVIIMTGYGDLDSAQVAIRLGVADFLTKPASLGEIEQALERARRRISNIREQWFQAEAVASDAQMGPGGPPEDEPICLRDVERQHILSALERHHGNRAAAAAELGVSVRKLYYKLAEYERGDVPP